MCSHFAVEGGYVGVGGGGNALQDRLLPRDARPIPGDPAPRDTTHAFPWEPRDDDDERPVGGVRYGRFEVRPSTTETKILSYPDSLRTNSPGIYP